MTKINDPQPWRSKLHVHISSTEKVLIQRDYVDPGKLIAIKVQDASQRVTIRLH